jgi:hypothetical protein
MYDITDYTKRKAKELGIQIKPSTRKHKKVDVYKNDKKIASIGDTRYTDYATLKEVNPVLARERRRLYHLRHNKNTTGEKLARELLW